MKDSKREKLFRYGGVPRGLLRDVFLIWEVCCVLESGVLEGSSRSGGFVRLGVSRPFRGGCLGLEGWSRSRNGFLETRNILLLREVFFVLKGLVLF